MTAPSKSNDGPTKRNSAPAVPHYFDLARQSGPRELVHQAARYSSFVRFMKRILPLAALGLALAVFGYAVQPRENGAVTITFERMGTIDDDLAMINPRLTGTDDNGLPFVVRATSAVQLGPRSQRVRLNDVDADLVMEDGTLLKVTAAEGIVDNRMQTLEIYGGISLSTEDGYNAQTASAHADLRQGIVRGEEPVVAEGNMGRLTAEGFTFVRATGTIDFTGGVDMQVNGLTR